MPKFLISSERLQLVEPLMEKYFDYHPTMLCDEKRLCLQNNDISDFTMNNDEKTVIIDYEEPFKEHKELMFLVSTPYKKAIHEQFSDYFHTQDNDEEEVITEDDKVWFSLEYMSYIYYKEKELMFYNSSIVGDLDIEYEIVLQHKIYPEILSLYKMILESKGKKNRSSKVTITHIQGKLDINQCSWFLDDMEKYFADRFPTLTLDKINEILPQYKGKAGNTFKDRIVANIIWGTYHLVKNHHSKFKDSKVKISNEMIEFIHGYLKYLGIYKDIEFINNDLKGMMKKKRNFVPKWDLLWRNSFTGIEEKQPETLEEIFNQPFHRYNIYT